MAGTTGLESATSDVTGIRSLDFTLDDSIIYRWLRGRRRPAVSGAKFNFGVNQLAVWFRNCEKRCLYRSSALLLCPVCFTAIPVAYPHCLKQRPSNPIPVRPLSSQVGSLTLK
jgi:hypothetical protein